MKGLLFLGVSALLAVGSTGCSAAVSGTHDTQFHFLVLPANGSFSGWTQIKVDGDINSVGTTNLWGVTLAVETPPEADLSFLANLKGEAVVGETRTPVAEVPSFSRGEQNASMNILYLGDLHPLFFDSSTIRLEWSGSTNPAFTAWPAEGIWIQGDVVINIQ